MCLCLCEVTVITGSMCLCLWEVTVITGSMCLCLCEVTVITGSMCLCLCQDMAENEGNLELAADLTIQLDELEQRASELDRLRSSNISSVRSVLTPVATSGVQTFIVSR